MNVAPLNRTLDQELSALVRGASYECLVCGEFVLHRLDGIGCPECGAEYGEAAEASRSGVRVAESGGPRD